MTSRRLYAPVVLTLLACGGFALFAATRAWLKSTVTTPGLPSDVVTVSGQDAAPAAAGLALVVIAAALAVLATAGWVRRAVGALVVVTSVVGAAIAQAVELTAEPLTRALAQSPAFTGGNDADTGMFTVWQLATVAGFLAAAMLGALVVALAGRWPTMGSRFESPGARANESRTEDDLWAALDEGRDPTE